ncbi:MAG: hypothetical protein LBB89_13585 [Treponema sp.]|jgi:hypothetical protein|nr:hypothetical protein [Treponema sp.]
MENEKKSGGKFRLVDLLVMLLCLTGAGFSVNLFWNDLFQTINAENKTPIGTVSIKRNIVQRRISDRVLWDRLIKESPVYSNDMIRVGDNSEAGVHAGGHDIVLNENTLVRLRYDKETGEFQIELMSGDIGLVTAPEGKDVALNIMGRKVQAKPGTALVAAAGDNGVALQVSEGTAAIMEEGQNRALFSGDMIAMDSEGVIRSEPSALVIQPRPNALYRTSGGEPLNVGFSWNRINLRANETLRLEIAQDINFSRSVRTLDGLNDSARAALTAGQWNWRLTYNNTVLDTGRFTITDAPALELLSPARNQQFFYESELPKLFFQWSGVEDISHYIVEVDVTPEFRNPIIKKQTTVTSFTDSSLREGIWYWRVTPVFSQANDNSAASNSAAAFRIVKSGEPQMPSLFTQAEEAPAPKPEPEPEPKIVYIREPAPPPKIVYVPAPAPEPRIIYIREGASEPAPVTRLPAPSNRQPVEDYRIGIEEVKKGNINFRWSAVPGANAYLFAIYQETADGRRQITQTGPENRTSWATDVKTLGRGDFIWRVEAVNVGKDNVIEQHGDPGENRFVIDIPQAGPARIISEAESSHDE